MSVGARVLLFGGPAGSGKTSLARAWCATRPRAAHVELDEVRNLIVAGLADPQEAGYDLAIDDVLEPNAFDRYWRAELEGLPWQLVAVLPSLDETLDRARHREKRVRETHIRAQHARCAEWDEDRRIDTSRLDLEQSLALVLERTAG